ncbi:MAG TPA: 30S ribosome-binding factor RbfA [Longimicrobiales bacterium]|nr:30S ribosome-binding factor RbfA [Longimicrobiales bacterium]
MSRKRVARLNEQLKRELTALLQFEVRDPRIGMVTITDVEVSPDLYHARVYYTLLGGPDERATALEGLRAAAGFLRTEIGRRMHIRRAPELHFALDETLDHAARIEQLLREARGDAPRDAVADSTSDEAKGDEAEGDESGGDDELHGGR